MRFQLFGVWLAANGEHGVSKYGIGENGIDKHVIGEYGIGEHGIGEYGRGEHGIGEHGIGEHGIGEYGIGEMLRHPQSRPPVFQDYQDPSRFPTVGHHGWPSAGEKSKCLKIPPHVPQVMIKLPLKRIHWPHLACTLAIVHQKDHLIRPYVL